MERILNLFEAPKGAIRSIPLITGPDYRLRYSQVGAFRRHEYDLDICTIYRQMDDLKVKYQDFAGKPYVEYVQQIKENVLGDLERLKLDADFYLEHFYCTIQPADVAYKSYLALFLSLSDYLKLLPLLEHHLKEFMLNDEERRGADGFLDLMEFQVCAFLRSNRFPEDWFAKHDKILNWVYTKRGQIENEKQQQEMMQRLIEAVNKTAKAAIPAEILEKSSKVKPEPVVRVIDEQVEILFEDIKVYFGTESHGPLKRILRGEGLPYEKVIFKGQGNQLVDVFRIYCEDNKIIGTKRAVGRFIVEHFMTLSDTDTTPQLIGANVENVIYNQSLPPKGKRIPLSGLKKRLSQYYGEKTT
ncbi:MAG: hypothetical protein U0T75_04620 [Chitinophagales bacterium]